MTNDRQFFEVSGILTLQVDCSEIMSDCSFKMCHSAVNFFKCFVYILHNFCVEIVRWVPLFNQYIFVDTSSWSNIQRASSPFEGYLRR
jgi:hypothetical protein